MRAGALFCVVIILIMIVACPQKQEDDNYQYTIVNYDSLFNLGDSAIKHHYIQQAEQYIVRDSLSRAMVDYKDQLTNREQVEAQIRQRVIFKDTVITRRHIVRKVDTIKVVIRDTVYVQETVIVPIKKRKRKRNESK